jgi:chitin disaccharide deacetylase
VIVNADDFGADEGTTRGIIEAHERGIVTSASLMVDMPGARSAVRAAREHPQLGVGLHVNFTAGSRILDPDDLRAQRQELERQLDRFSDMTGQSPTHIDSHHHVHRRAGVASLFIELCRDRRIPLRGFSGITYVGHFYGQWDHGETDVRHISPDYLISLLRSIAPGFSELACHPGDHDARFDPVYDWQRQIELESLTDPRVSAAAAREGIRLINYREYGRLAPASSARIAGYWRA